MVGGWSPFRPTLMLLQQPLHNRKLRLPVLDRWIEQGKRKVQDKYIHAVFIQYTGTSYQLEKKDKLHYSTSLALSRSCVPYLVTMYFYFVCFGWMYRGSKFSELLARSHQIIQYIVLTVGNYSRHPPSIAQYQFSWTLYKFVSTKKRKWNKVLSPLTLLYLAKEKGVLRCYHKYLFAFFLLGQ